MENSGAGTVTWLILFMLMMTSCPWASGVSEAYSHHDTSTTLYSSINYLKCTSDVEVNVSTTQEISDLMKLYINEPVRMRATHRGFHSSMGLVCAGRRGSSYPEHSHEIDADPTHVTSITVLMHLMNKVVDVDVDGFLMTVEAGMTLGELVAAAGANDMSVHAGALSGYGNLTVGGVILASAHGSGYRATSSLGDLVKKMKWVNARGEIIESDVENEEGAREVRALVGGIGLLGIVTEITLQLQPNSRTIVEVRKDLQDGNMVAELRKLLHEETPHVNAFWRPDFGMYKAVLWTQVEDGDYNSATMPPFYPNGSISLLSPLDEPTASTVKELMSAWEDDVHDEFPSADVLNAGICKLGQMIFSGSAFQDGNGKQVDHATIPTNNAMVSPECSPKCVFDVHYVGAFTEDIEFTIKLSRLEDWVNDVKLIVGTELAEVEARLRQRYGTVNGTLKRCIAPGIGFIIRFGQGTQNLLCTSAGSEDVAYVQPSVLHSALHPTKPSKMSTIMETIEQLTLCKYQGRPHWGKNHERVARHPECHVLENFPAGNVAALLEMQQRHDPRKVFEPELFTEVLKKSGPVYSPLCSANYWCYCTADWHCPAGFQCRGSASFSQYKICRLAEPVTTPSSI